MEYLHISSLKRFIASSCALLALPMKLMATQVNLMNQNFTTANGTVGQSILPGSNVNHRMGFIGDALFRRTEATDTTGSGGGIFRNMYRVSEPGNRKEGWQNGYNRNNAGDASVPGGFVGRSLLTRGDLVSDAASGYYVFTVDVNESNNATNRFMSLDSFKIYAGGTGIDADNSGDLDPSEVTEAWGSNPLPQTSRGNSSELAAYTTLIYDMDAIEDSTVFIDYSSGTGSGTFDFFIFVPINRFNAVTETTLLYIFTEFGSYTGSTSLNFRVDSGSKEISVYTGDYLGDLITTNLPIPEPSTSLLSALGALLLLCKRTRA